MKNYISVTPHRNKQKLQFGKHSIDLLRLNKPIGIWLFLWPTLWALWLAARGIPPLKILVIFILGLVVMRSAGCIINDLFDRNFDRYVERTKNRPLVKGQITLWQANVLFFLLTLLAAYLAFQLNLFTLAIAAGIFLFALLYPLAKRWFPMPQLFLGATVAGAVPMAFTAILNQLPVSVIWIYLAALLWPMIYDTFYAMVDAKWDAKIGIKSTALLFGHWAGLFTAILQLCMIGLLIMIGLAFSQSLPYYFSVGCAVLLFIRQQVLIKNREPTACFKAFLESHWVGFVIFIGIFLNYFCPLQSIF